MAKLYVFGIGGTGSRVLKSLTMLMAAGVKVQDSQGSSYEVVPIVIDPDHAAADLTRTVKLMQDYNKVYNRLDHNSSNGNTFFSTKINMDIIPSVRMPLNNTIDVDFKKYIGLSGMKDEGKPNGNYALTSMLFSKKNLDAKMEVGFKGNPNIGSVVLNQFALSKEFTNFTSSFGQDDRIFIISSIFGGTGAAGFPLLLKKLRSVDQAVPGQKNVRNAVVGAITVLPYFDVQPSENSEIDSSSFVSKTKAALSYYCNNMTEANVLYYIGDKGNKKQYSNSEGGSTQRNEAHFVELVSALAIVDFAALSDLSTNNGEPANPVYKEFGIRDDAEQIIFANLDAHTNNTLKKPLTAFTMFCKYLKEQIGASKGQPWAKDLKFDDNFLNGAFFKTELSDIKNAYLEWLSEMNNNRRAFSPYDLRERKNDVYSLIKGETPAHWRAKLMKSNYALFDDVLNDNQTKVKRDASKEHIFVELFCLAITKLIKQKFRL
jgi:hypothetical protein